MKKTKTTRGTKRTIFIYLLILAAFYVVIYIVPQVSDIFVETYSAEYGTLQIRDEATCLFVRKEKTYTAPFGGQVDRVIGRGRLMRTSARIVDVGGTACYSDMRGIVSYYYDGLEEVYTPESISTLKSSVLDNIRDSETSQVKTAPEDTAQAGDVIFKIVDNQQWFLVCWISNDSIGRYSQGAAVTVDFLDGKKDEESTCIKMEVYSMEPQGEQTMVVLSCNRSYEDFDRFRIRDCALITSDISGILLETDSVVEEDGQKGVYVVDKLGKYSFTPIQILAQDGEITVAEKNYFYDAAGNSVKTVKNYDEILRPEKEKAAKDAGETGQADEEE